MAISVLKIYSILEGNISMTIRMRYHQSRNSKTRVIYELFSFVTKLGIFEDRTHSQGFHGLSRSFRDNIQIYVSSIVSYAYAYIQAYTHIYTHSYAYIFVYLMHIFMSIFL